MAEPKGTVQHLPFSVLNQEVKSKLADASIYQTTHWSFLKVFEHAITYAALGNDKKLIRHAILRPIWLQQLTAILKKWKARESNTKPKLAPVVIIDPVRLTQSANQEYHSIYLSRWIDLIPTSKRTVVQRKADPRVPRDYSLEQFARCSGAFDHQEVQMLSQIQEVFHKAISSNSFSSYELQHIGSTLFIFWEDFRFYHNWLKSSRVQKLLFICHYHNEGLIAACKVNGIQSIELQHGLISRNDLYYVYDQQFKTDALNAMFPDLLFVYGSYWRDIVLEGVEFGAHQVKVAGDYLFRGKAEVSHLIRKENVLLVCAQKMMHKDYLHYLELLRTYLLAHLDWRVVVKMHPLEPRKDLYQVVKNWGFELIDMEKSLDDLLRIAKIQISIYSTTFFDAVGFDVVNFSIQNFGSSSDYAAEIVREAVAFPIRLDENPILKYLDEKADLITMTRDQIYQPFDPALAMELLDIPE